MIRSTAAAARRSDRKVRFTPADLREAALEDIDHDEATTSADIWASGFEEVNRDETSWAGTLPAAQGLYDPENEKDSCGVGFMCQIKGKPAHKIVTDAKALLCNMTHRGAVGADARDGDGAGVMTGLPDYFFRREVERDLNCKLPAQGQYAVGNLFFNPKEDDVRQKHIETFEKLATELHLRVLGWREVPVDNSILGPSALSKEPKILQPFVVLSEHFGLQSSECENPTSEFNNQYFGRQLYVLRKSSTHTIGLHNWFYICSLSPTNIVYKGQLSPRQVYDYYHDLNNAHYASHFALVHSRFSTNTFPSWDRAQPMRWAAHNGEINTIRGNKNWMRAREGQLKSETFGDELEMLYPIIENGGSDSAAFDNVLELMVVNNVISLPQAVMMMVPEAWQGNEHEMEPAKVAFYQWAANLMEPWDGPALFTFSDGRYCGANLDRNGLRPCRYCITDDDIMVCASETGAVTIAPERILAKGRLQPGKMLLVDTVEGRVIDDRELKLSTAKRADFAAWLESHVLKLPEVISTVSRRVDIKPKITEERLSTDPRLLAMGYTAEQISLLMLPMVTDGKEALGSMGNDAPLACLANAPRLIYDFFRQLFAQVTNPPIDPIREAIVMSLLQFVGPEGNLLEMRPDQCHRLLLESPILDIREMNALKEMDKAHADWPAKTLDITFDKADSCDGYTKALDRTCSEASQAIRDGYKIVVLSDRNIGPDRVAISSLVACGGLHHHLIRNKERSRIALMVETAEAREVHHFSVLVGYGADAICPWLAIEAMYRVAKEGLLKTDMSDEDLIKNYKKSIDSGILKIMSKMGVSTLQSYKGAQVFEILGLDSSVVDRCFAGSASRIAGANFDLLAMDALEFHDRGYPTRATISVPGLPESGEYHWRDGGEAHVNDPISIANLQDAAREKNQAAYDAYSKSSTQSVQGTCLRGLLDFRFEEVRPIPIDQVEPWTEIVQRFATGAMSYGSISMEAHSALAIAMNRLGGKSNTGEGGEDAERSIPLPNGDSLRSKIKQIASGRFGVTSAYIADSDQLQIKMAQGAKPGEGGELPGHKVSPSIAKTRHSTAGVGLISPPPHHDLYSIEDLAELIYDLKCANPRANISVKLVSEVGVGVVAAGVAKAKAEHIVISGHDGGTGAARWSSIKYAGLPFELGIAETHQTLVLNDLRGRVFLQADGNIRTGRDVAIACLLGAEEFGFATSALIALGCIMMRKCLAADTLIRTPFGTSEVAQLKVGDQVLNEQNLPVFVTGAANRHQEAGKKITYFDDQSQSEASFIATADHRLTLVAANCNPQISTARGGRQVRWMTRCHHDHHKDEVSDLAFEAAGAKLLQAFDQTDDAVLDAAESKIADITEHYHRAGEHCHGPALDEYIDVLTRDEKPQSEVLSARDICIASDEEAADYDMGTASEHSGESDEWEDTSSFSGSRATSRHGSPSTTCTSLPSRGCSPEPLCSTSPVVTASMKEDQMDSDIDLTSSGLFDDDDPAFLEKIKVALTERKCSINGFSGCPGMRWMSFTFGTAQRAREFLQIMSSPLAESVDAGIVREGDLLNMTVQEFESGICMAPSLKMQSLKLYGVPSGINEGSDDVSEESLPLDPYFLGLWLGDGVASQPAITSSDQETKVWLSKYVDRLNTARPVNERLSLHEHVTTSQGQSGVHTWSIRLDRQDHSNPVTDALRALGILNNKAAGIPDMYMAASEQAKLKLLAGLIESDGFRITNRSGYGFLQYGEEHRQIVGDARKLASLAGIDVTPVHEVVNRSPASGSVGNSGWRFDMSGGCDKLQPFLTMERKRLPAGKSSRLVDTRPILSVEDCGSTTFRAIEVSGGLMQLADRTVVANCHLNTCPVGVATQDPVLREKFAGQPEHVINFFYYLSEELRGIMAKLGLRTVNEMVGRSEMLKVNQKVITTPKLASVDLSPLLKPAHKMRPGAATYRVRKQDFKLYTRLDNMFLDEAEPALAEGLPVQMECQVVNTDRALGATLSYKVSKLYGEEGLPKDTIHINAKGSAGQSCGAFLAPGITIELEGDANDYVGKGMSGGRLIVYPPKNSSFKAEENIIVGNVCLYGATSGHAYIRGIAAERFAVRNSGAHAVVEGTGDHCAEYMTGGRLVVLGPTGRNACAGMSGGILYVLDMNRDFRSKCNTEGVELGPVKDPHEIAELRNLIENHRHYTGSTVADHVIHDFHHLLPRFVRVMPLDYKRVLEEEAAKAAAEKKRSSHVDLLGTLSRHGSQVDVSLQDDKASDIDVGSNQVRSKAEPAVVDMEDSMVDDETARARVGKLDKTRGFIKYKRLAEHYRNPAKRVKDFKELSARLTDNELKQQTARCMDCGVPFCQSDTGCPISNVIPKWNDLVFKGQWRDALNKLMLTNNFPEFTGRVCPAPCESACVLGIIEQPVGIKSIECAIIDKGWEMGWMVPRPPQVRTGKAIAVIGSGPAGLAAADQLNRAGHSVTVYERADQIGGLLYYGIPNMKLDKGVVGRRIKLMEDEGVKFIVNAEVGKDIDAKELEADNDAVIFATGATWPRDLKLPGREANGVAFAMSYLTSATKCVDKGLTDDAIDQYMAGLNPAGKHVVVIGGGDTGNDCIGTSVRLGAASVTNLELLPQPPETRARDNPWPQFARIFKTDYGHTEVTDRFGKDPRRYCTTTKEFVKDDEGNLVALKIAKVDWQKDASGKWNMSMVPGSEEEIPCNICLLAMGFLGPEDHASQSLGLERDGRSNIKAEFDGPKAFQTSVSNVWSTGDCRRGQSLVVHAINEGRRCAASVDRHLEGNTRLPWAGGIPQRSWTAHAVKGGKGKGDGSAAVAVPAA